MRFSNKIGEKTMAAKVLKDVITCTCGKEMIISTMFDLELCEE